jgi:hypothetical protein
MKTCAIRQLAAAMEASNQPASESGSWHRIDGHPGRNQRALADAQEHPLNLVHER